MKNYHFLLLASLFLALACQPKTENPLHSFFKSSQSSDTLHLEVSDENGKDTGYLASGDTIPNSLFFSEIDTALLKEIDYLADSAQASVIGRLRFPLDENSEAYLVDIRENWFQNQSLFIFDKKKNSFTQRQTVAEWYGGEGGQVLTGSWLFDFDGDGKKDLVRREIEHSMVMGENENDEPRETQVQRATLLLWKNGKFEEAPADSAALVKRFPINSFW